MIINRLTIMAELGQDATLLIKSDDYLETKRQKISSDLSNLATELQKIQRTQRIKRMLQNNNYVAVKCTEYLNDQAAGEVIKIMPLPDALKLLNKEPEPLRKQKNLWLLDGYDVQTSEQLREPG